MATTIKSTELDFDTIKNNLKVYLEQTNEFSDYNFEASGLSSLLDVLAYNTHYNSLLANFALNESFLPTAQLRSSIVSLAAALGYTVRSTTASCAAIRIYVTNPLVPSTMTLPAGFSFTTTVNNKSYTFKTRQTLTAVNNGANQYYFQLGENQNIAIYEGVEKTQNFIVGPVGENESFLIPTQTLDLETVKVRVYKDTSTQAYDTYTNLNDATTLDKNSRIFVCKESPNGVYELTFGNGARLGKFPEAGNKIEVLYDQVGGPAANGARTFTPVNQIRDIQNQSLPIVVTTIHGSRAGSTKESIESVRKNAPYLYSAQNRMVTAQDYASLVLRKYSNVIDDIKSWGGEDNIPPQFGTVFLSIVYNTEQDAIQNDTKQGIIALAKNLSVASFNIEFTNPNKTFLEVNTLFQWNPNLTSLAQTAIQNKVNQTVEDYFTEQLGGFDKSFRRSNMLTLIDDADPSILSSRSSIRMQNRFVPVSNKKVYEVSFPVGIAAPDDDQYIIQSGTFNISSVDNSTKVCFLRNRLESRVIEVIDINTGKPLLDNIGEYNESTGIISFSNFTGVLIAGEPNLKITAVPANESTISAKRNNILGFDETASKSSAVITDTV
tara:strand:+ start:21338 stop:23158 length:1821 start_codon:yes stop_codon:yes gene_type:complete